MFYLRYLLVLSFLFLSSVNFAESADDNTGRDDSQVYHIYKDVDLVTNLKTLSGKDPKFFVKSVYPQLEGDKEDPSLANFNNLVVQLIQQEINAFQHNAAQNQKVLQNLPKKASRTSTFYIDFDTSTIKSNQDHIISVRFIMQGNLAGMAHPFHYHRVLNYDIDTGEKIELADLFKPNSNYLNILSNYARMMLDKRLSDKSMIINGTMPIPDNYKNWNIKPNGLVITFDEAQVAPYVNGAQMILIPFSDLSDILDPASVLADCINHRKQCMRSNILTGGFIDTAANTLHRSLNPILRKL